MTHSYFSLEESLEKTATRVVSVQHIRQNLNSWCVFKCLSLSVCVCHIVWVLINGFGSMLNECVCCNFRCFVL